MNILIVLAKETERESVREMIAALRPDAELRLFDSGLTALADARKQEADIAVIDTELPELGGLDFGQYLQELYPDVNLIYLSSDKAAGYTVRGNQVAAAPSGARMAYDLWIPADGLGDHPSYKMACLSADALASIGVTLNVIDLASSADLWTGIEADNADMWCAAWGATPDPDMYQVYYSGVATGYEPGGSNYMYDIADAQLDRLILEARGSADQSYRKKIYKQALDIIIDWAVEVPVYQRQNAIVFSPERVKISTLTPDITTYYGWLSEIQNVEVR